MNIPRSVIRNQMKALRREQARQVRAAAPGEKMMAALNPNRGYSWTTWTADRQKQIWHMKNWVGVCIDKIASLVAQLVPNVAYVSPKSDRPQKRFKDGSRFNGNLNYFDCAGHSFCAGGYRRKALGVIKPHENLEPVEQDHPLRRLIESPNDWDTQYDHDYELIMFQLLCGVAYDWAVPHEVYGQYPKELWCIPSNWVWPRTGTGEAVDPQNPFADRIIAYYEIRPWPGGSWGPIRIPPDQIIRYTYKSPISKIDGWAKTQLMANWIDADDSIAKSQFAQMSNAAMPSFWLELGEGYEDPTDDQIDRIGSKFMTRYTGELNMGRPFIGPPGTVPHPLSFPPLHMAYGESGDQSRDRIISGFGLNLPILGLSENQTFGSVLANLMGASVYTFKPLLTGNGQRKTKDIASKFGNNLRVWYDDPAPIDPDQLNKDIDTDAKNGSITPNEIREIRGRQPYEHGGDDPLVPGPGGLVPLPLGTGYDLSGYADLMPLLGRQDNPAAKEEEDESGTLDSPQVDEPNGAPKKRLRNRRKTFNENDHPRNESGEFGPKNGLPGVGEQKPAKVRGDIATREYVEAFNDPDNYENDQQMKEDVNNANQELWKEDSKFRVAPDGDGGWKAMTDAEIRSEYDLGEDEYWVVRQNMNADWVIASEDKSNQPYPESDQLSDEYADEFNGDPGEISPLRVNEANEHLAEEESEYRVWPNPDTERWEPVPVESLVDDYGENWSIQHGDNGWEVTSAPKKRLSQTKAKDLKRKSNQPRVPAGSSEGGQFGPKNGLPSGQSNDASFIDYASPGYEKHPMNEAVLDAQSNLSSDSFDDPAKTLERIQSCIDSSIARNREALAHVPEDKRGFLESWQNRQGQVLKKPADDLAAKASAFRDAEKAMQEHETKEPQDTEAEGHEEAYDTWSDERDDLEGKMDKLSQKADDARERFLDKLDTFNLNFADKVMELMPQKKTAPKKQVKRTSRRTALRSSLPSLNGFHK